MSNLTLTDMSTFKPEGKMPLAFFLNTRLAPEFAENLRHLSERELEVIQLLSRGLNTREIADMLNLSEHTIATHRKQIIRKSGCRNTAHLVATCLRCRLI